MLSFMFIKNSPEKLSEAYLEEKDQAMKGQILSRLLELNAGSFIEKLFIKSPSLDLFELIKEQYGSLPDKMYDIYEKTTKEFKTEIIYHLINIDAESVLFKLLKSDSEIQIIDYLMSKYFDQMDAKIDLLGKVSDTGAKYILDKLLKLGNPDSIKALYESDHKYMLISRIFSMIKSNEVDQDEFISSLDSSIKGEILKLMIHNKDLKDNYNYDYIQIAIIKTHECDINEFLLFWEPYISLITINKALLINFFSRLNERQQLFMLLWAYGIEKYMKVPKLKFSLSDIENYYYLVEDCASLGLEHICYFFQQIFDDSMQNLNHRLLTLSHLVDRNMCKTVMADAILFFNDMYDNSSGKANIKAQNYKQMIEQLNDTELYRIPFYSQDIFVKLSFYDEPLTGYRIDLRAFNKDTKIVEDIEHEKQAIQDYLDKMTARITSPAPLVRLKDVASVKIANLVSLNDFIFSLNTLNLEENEDSDHIIEVLINTFQKTPLLAVQKMIMKKLINTDRFEGSNKIYNENLVLDDSINIYYFNYLNRNQVSPNILLTLVKSLCNPCSLVYVFTIKHLMAINHIAFSADSKYIASSGNEKTIQIVELANNNMFKYYHSSEITHLIATPDNKYYISEDRDYQVKMFDLTSLTAGEAEKKNANFELMAYAKKKSILAERRENEVKFFDYVNKKTIKQIKQSQFINNIIITNNDKYALSYGFYELVIIDIDGKKPEYIIKSKRAINCIDVSSNSRYMIVGLGDRWKGEVRIYELETTEIVWSQEFDNSVSCVAFSKDVRYFSVCLEVKERSTLSVYEMYSKNIIANYNSDQKINSCFFWTNTNFVAIIRKYSVVIFDLKENMPFHIFRHDEPITNCSVSAEGLWLAISSGIEAKIYHLLDSQKQSAYNLLQNFLAYRLDQDTSYSQYFDTNKARILNECPIEHQKKIKELVNYLSTI